MVKQKINYNKIKIGSFNIKNFGEKKWNNNFVRDIIIDIIQRYDICFIIEIRDKHNKFILSLVDFLPSNYNFVITTNLRKK